MFGTKKAKEVQEKMQELEGVQERYLQLHEDVCDVKNISDEVFAALDSEDIQLVQGLNYLQDVMREEKTKTDDITKQVDALSEGLTEMFAEGERINASLTACDETFAEGKGTALLLAQTAELCEKAAEHTKTKHNSDANVLKQPIEDVAKLKESAKEMTTIALNAAIEAGRLGGVGLNFLQAAEKVRKLSEEYTRMLVNLQEEMSKAQEQLVQTEYLKELSDVVQKTKESAERMKIFETEKQITGRNLTDLVCAQQRTVEDIREALGKKDDTYQAVLEQMELIGQNHEQTREEKESLEEKLALFYGKTL